MIFLEFLPFSFSPFLPTHYTLHPTPLRRYLMILRQAGEAFQVRQVAVGKIPLGGAETRPIRGAFPPGTAVVAVVVGGCNAGAVFTR